MIEIQVVIAPDKAAGQLHRFAGAITPEVDAALGEIAAGIREEAATYEPPPKPSYRRTGYMAAQTTFQRRAAATYVVQMNAPYSKYVRGVAGGRRQAWMHAGRWNLWQQIVDRHTGQKLVEVVRNAIERAIKKAGL